MTTTLPMADATPAVRQDSPDWVRISYASAIALRFRSGRFSREFKFGGINLLLSYDSGCLSDCGYCGLARNRPGEYDDKSFIRVEWPLVRTDEFIDRLVRYEDRLTRLCISMVTHGRAYPDTLELTERITSKVRAPLSLLVAPPTLNEERLRSLKAAGADMIGIGMDAVTEDLFASLRTNVPQGGLKWDQYWETVAFARDIYGPWHVNCHTLVGLGENDAQLMDIFGRLLNREVFSYLFCFNPEPDSRLGDRPKTPIERWRRIQLAKFLLEERGLDPAAFRFDDDGMLSRIRAPRALIDEVVADGYAFMTNGCPSSGGEPGCTRPMGSWRPTESPRDYPWRPTAEDQAAVREQLDLEALIEPGPGPTRPAHLCAPPAAGRFAPNPEV
ncbi:radical SAM protein [Paraconexibacter antarcticus]|uniref:Radical SAM protein n=1 Tax=Paraconexibacter antarcticus TaxID=2949664 RepID=A0ABY5E100_9ACTN|nr:radical SAM protein [Paraconexibacter antarcticus]UTI66884.1 radical SAM protein [Paraconexibacter antarcticus]